MCVCVLVFCLVKTLCQETPDPVAISPCEHVEFKFVRIRLGGAREVEGMKKGALDGPVVATYIHIF